MDILEREEATSESESHTFSVVWDHFVKKGDHKTAQCCHCGKEIRYHGPTSNLLRHLQAKHPCKVPSVINDNIKNLITQLFIDNLLPFSFVESASFKALVSATCNGALPPSRYFLKQDLNRRYAAAVALLSLQLMQCFWKTLTFDLWTSSSQVAFITVTVHWMEALSARQRTHVLGAYEFGYAEHTAKNINNRVRDICKDFNLPVESSFVVADGASNVGAACRLLGCIHIHCAAHKLNLVVQKALEEVEDLRSACRKIVGHFRHSSKATERLKEHQRRLNQQPVKKLSNEVPTRWNSFYYSAERLLELRQATGYALVDNKSNQLQLSQDQWTLLEQVVDVLEPLAVLTAHLQDQDVPISYVIPAFNVIHRQLSPIAEDPLLLRQFKSVLASNLSDAINYYKSIEPCALATAVDPRFRLRDWSSNNAINAVYNTLLEEMKQADVLLQEGKRRQQEEEEEGEEEEEKEKEVKAKENEEEKEEEEEEEESFKTKKRRLSVEKMIFGTEPTATASSPRSVSEELHAFMVLPAIPEKRDPRTWWREHCHLFPRLYHVALKYLSIPATSAESERIFSLTGNILSPHRSTLSSQRLNQLVFLKHYQL